MLVKIGLDLKILVDAKVEDFFAINFGKYFTYIREEKNLR